MINLTECLICTSAAHARGVTNQLAEKLVRFLTISLPKLVNVNLILYIPYSRKYWRSLNLAVWAPDDVFHTIQDLNLAVWYSIAIHTCMRKKFGGF